MNDHISRGLALLLRKKSSEESIENEDRFLVLSKAVKVPQYQS